MKIKNKFWNALGKFLGFPVKTEETNQEAAEPQEKENFIKSAKKAVSTAIKAFFSFATDVLNFVFDVLIIGLIVATTIALGVVTAYAINAILVNLGVIALAITLWETQGVAQITLLVLALTGVVNIAVGIAELIWHLLLKHIHVFLWSILLRDVSKLIPTEKQIQIVEVEAKAVNSNEPPQKEPAMTIKFIEVPLEKVSETVTVVDSSPTITPIPEPVVIEIEEVVDSSPTTETQEDIKSSLLKKQASELRKEIAENNKKLPAPHKVKSHGSDKGVLVERILQQRKYLSVA